MPMVHIFENTQGQRVTVNGIRYREMLTEYFFPIVVPNNLQKFNNPTTIENLKTNIRTDIRDTVRDV